MRGSSLGTAPHPAFGHPLPASGARGTRDRDSRCPDISTRQPGNPTTGTDNRHPQRSNLHPPILVHVHVPDRTGARPPGHRGDGFAVLADLQAIALRAALFVRAALVIDDQLPAILAHEAIDAPL